jgi:outer membrane protein assembly factor BamB
MSDYRSAIEREIERVQPRPYSFEVFNDRRLRAARRRRAGATVLGVLMGATVVLSMVYALRGREHPTPATPPISPQDVSDLHVAWSRDTGASIDSTPVVVGDRVYVTNTAGTLLAFPTSCGTASATCRPIWTANEGSGSTFGIGSAAVGDGMVLAGSVQGRLFGYPTSCEGVCRPIWTARPGGDLSSASPVVAGGIVYVGSSDGTFYAYPAGCSSYPRPCPPLWTAPLRGGFGAAGYAGAQPVVADGVVYVGSTRGTLYAFPASCSSPCEPLHEVRLPGVLNNPLVLVGRTLYVTSGRDLYAFATHCLDRTPCGPDWVGSASALILSPPAVGDGHVYVGSTDGAVWAFPETCGQGGATCRPAWSIPDLGLLPNPSLVDGVLFVGSSWAVKELLAFDADCGASGTCSPLWTFETGDFGWLVQQTASDGGGGTLFAVTGDPTGGGAGGAGGTLYAFHVGSDPASHQVAGVRNAPSFDFVTVSLLGLAAALAAIWWRRRIRRGIRIEA